MAMFDPTLVHVTLVMYEVDQGQAFPEYFHFPLSISFDPYPSYAQVSFNYHQRCTTAPTDSVGK